MNPMDFAQEPEPSQRQWLLATGTLVAGLGVAAGVVLYDSKYRDVARAAAFSGLVLYALVQSVRVLRGEPTPRLGLR